MLDTDKQLPAKVVLEGRVVRNMSDLTIPLTVDMRGALDAMQRAKERLRQLPPIVRKVQPWERDGMDDCINGESTVTLP